MIYEEYQIEELNDLIQNGIVLFVTATDIETKTTHEKLTPINGFKGVIQVYDGANTYYLGQFGKYNIAHVQCNMGSVARDSSIMTITSAISSIRPKFVLMVGIAFGVDNSKQSIGDVLISEGIIPYDNERVGKETIHRGQNAPSSKILLNRFKSIKTWEFFLENDLQASKIFTQILSGEELIDNIERRDELVRSFPNAKGGEMEGAGLFAACDGKAEWIIVKGICDFADGNKGLNKEANQKLAINSALSLCLELFNSNHAFRVLGLNPAISESVQICDCKHENVDDVLFEVYNEENETYYIDREEDKQFNQILSQYCIWIYGVSGCGKTNLILRNLISNKSNFISISLASCIGLGVHDIFREILIELTNQFEEEYQIGNNDSFSNLSRNILILLERNCKEKELIIFIEEIPISEDNEYKQFVTHFFSLLISKKLIRGLNNIKFVLSSIKNPTKHIQEHQLKIHQQLKFIQLENWKEDDVKELISMICKNLSVTFDEGLMQNLIKTSNCSPRFIKKFFRNILACCQAKREGYDKILSETERELKQFYNG